jgi:3D-(3,5/4)-trihydroxycyclohexane-1,2-dione acylhydrolase (decyclizing)
LCIATDPRRTTEAGGCWWDVAIPEQSPSHKVRGAREAYERARRAQKA